MTNQPSKRKDYNGTRVIEGYNGARPVTPQVRLPSAAGKIVVKLPPPPPKPPKK